MRSTVSFRQACVKRRRAWPDSSSTGYPGINGVWVSATSDAGFNRFLRAAELEFPSTSAGARAVNIIRDELLLDSFSEIGEVFGGFKPNDIDEPVVLADIDDLAEPFF